MEKRGKNLKSISSKKAQFYLIAAIIIIGIIIGLTSVANYITTKKKPVKFYDLSSELNEEGARVIDYGIYNAEDIPTRIENFLDNYIINYSERKEKGTELAFVYGNKTNVTVATYTTEKTGKVTITYGGTSFDLSGTDKYVKNKTSKDMPTPQDYVVVEILGATYNFTLHKGENFLFVINKNTTEETYIVGSQK